MAIQLPRRCCWLCKWAQPSRNSRPIEEMLAAPLRTDRIICTSPRRRPRRVRCPYNPHTICSSNCRGTSCRHWAPAISWLKGDELKKIPECKHQWELIGIAMPHFVEWCSQCGSIRRTNQRQSAARRPLAMIWSQCRHNPKMPRVLLEGMPSKMSEEEAQVRKLLAATAVKQGMITLSDEEIALAGIAPDVKITRTKNLELTVIKLKTEEKDGKATATRKSDS